MEQEKQEKYKKILKLISNGNLIDVVQEDCCKIILKDTYITEDVIQSTIEYYRILRWLYILKKDSEESQLFMDFLGISEYDDIKLIRTLNPTAIIKAYMALQDRIEFLYSCNFAELDNSVALILEVVNCFSEISLRVMAQIEKVVESLYIKIKNSSIKQHGTEQDTCIRGHQPLMTLSIRNSYVDLRYSCAMRTELLNSQVRVNLLAGKHLIYPYLANCLTRALYSKDFKNIIMLAEDTDDNQRHLQLGDFKDKGNNIFKGIVSVQVANEERYRILTQGGNFYCYKDGFLLFFNLIAPIPPYITVDKRGKVDCDEFLRCRNSYLQVVGEGFAFTYIGTNTSFPMAPMTIAGQNSTTEEETPHEKFINQLKRDLEEKFKISVYRVNTFYYNEPILSGKGQGDLYGIGSMKLVLLDKEGEWIY